MSATPGMRPFEVDEAYLQTHLDTLVSVTFADLQSQFLLVPKGENFIPYTDFQDAYEELKRQTGAFTQMTTATVWEALRINGLAFVVLRTMLGMTPPEWAELAATEHTIKLPQSYARTLDTECRTKRDLFARLTPRRRTLALQRIEALVAVAVRSLSQPVPTSTDTIIHRLDKVDTTHGLISLQFVAAHHVPYAMLLYERYLGRPFASHRDAVSELVGDVMESAIEERLSQAGISFRKTKRAERVPGYDQAPDFFIPDEYNPAVLIESKITNDAGTARDKITRIIHLTELRDERLRQGQRGFQVVACIDGRGFGVRREDMRRLLLKTQGKVFTTATLEQLISHTRLQEFLPLGSQ